MAKFMYLYRGKAPELTPEQGAERMAAFGAWIERVGPALIDGGSPFGASTSLRDDGSEVTASELFGYSVVEADGLDAARALTAGLPVLAGGNGDYAVEIFELMAM